jgi:Zn-dependent M28 family amino/carboxypeptidase
MYSFSLLFLTATLFLSTSANPQQKNETFFRSFYSLDKDYLKDHVQVLGHDSLEGRGTGSLGEKKSAEYIKDNFYRIGLKPIGNDGTYYQNIPMHGSTPQQESELKIFLEDSTFNLELGKDYILLNSGEQTFIPTSIPLVFAGYGIIAPEFDYNDYQSIDPAGKIVVMLEGEPISNDPEYFGGESPTIYSFDNAKQRLAISRGAYGTILIPNPHENDSNWETRSEMYSGERITLAYNPSDNFSIIINPHAAELIFNSADFSLRTIYEDHIKNSIKSFDLPAAITFREEYKERNFISSNIVGLAGDDKNTEEYIIVSAHYDHLGIGNPMKGDSIYNGVFDNAAGVAAVIELARAFKIIEKDLKRSIIFLVLTGEEKGLLGSTYYTDNPIIPLYKTAANVNIDGISLFDKVKSFVAVGSEFSTLGEFADNAAKELDLKISDIPSGFDSENAFYVSDQIAFAMAGIPAIITMEGIDYENLSEEEGKKKLINFSENIYHTPFDDLNQQLNYDAALQHVQFLFTLIFNLAQSENSPEWKPDSPFLNIRLQTKAEKR